VMLHINRMVFGAPEREETTSMHEQDHEAKGQALPFSCRLALLLAAAPVFVFGFYIPKPLQDLLTRAADALTK
jgi:hypothetical protein